MKLAEIIKDYLKSNRYTINELARRSGLSPTYVGKLKRGDKENPSVDALEKLADAMGMSVEELSAKMKDQTFSKASKNKIVGYEFIPLFSGLSCGAGTFVDEKAENFIPIPDAWRRPNKSYFANEADGDSMTGREIHNGDILIFERADVLDNGEIGSFFLRGENLCKTFRRLTDDTVLLESANPKYDPIVVDLKKDTDFRVIGRLAYQITKRLGV